MWRYAIFGNLGFVQGDDLPRPLGFIPSLIPTPWLHPVVYIIHSFRTSNTPCFVMIHALWYIVWLFPSSFTLITLSQSNSYLHSIRFCILFHFILSSFLLLLRRCRCNFAVRYIVPDRVNIIKILEAKRRFGHEVELDTDGEEGPKLWAKMTFKPRLIGRLLMKRNKTIWRELDSYRLGNTNTKASNRAKGNQNKISGLFGKKE